jgi:hypothetical protein
MIMAARRTKIGSHGANEELKQGLLCPLSVPGIVTTDEIGARGGIRNRV